MATELMMPTLPDQTRPHFYPPPVRPHHARSQSYQTAPTSTAYNPQMSPLSALSSANASPTSPKSYLSRQQPRGPTSYIPAVLRPTEFPCKPPTSRSNRSPPGDDVASLDGDTIRSLRRSSNSFISLPGLSVLGSRLSRRSTGDSGKCVDESEWDLDMFPEVHGLPSREHWKPDPKSTVCDDPTCKRTFSYFTRRHHCRKCGNIFCDAHSAFAIPLDQNCNYNPRGSPSRSCSHCYSEFRNWKSLASSQVGSAASSDAASSGAPSAGKRRGGPSATAPNSPITTNGSPGAASPMGAPGAPPAGVTGRGPAEVAASVPRDWNWSTF